MTEDRKKVRDHTLLKGYGDLHWWCVVNMLLTRENSINVLALNGTKIIWMNDPLFHNARFSDKLEFYI